MRVDRRSFLQGAATALGAGAGLLGASGPAFAAPPLRDRARAKGVTFGCAINSQHIRSDAAYAAAIEREAGAITPDFELKWGTTEAVRGRLNHAAPDFLWAFAQRNKMMMRGHTPIWYRNMPNWAAAALETDAETVLKERILGPVGHFRGRIAEWDVVNEPVEPEHGRPDLLRKSVWLDALGPGYIDEAFRLARAADPAAILFVNEYGVDFDNAYSRNRRRAVLKLLEGFRKRNVPVDALGIQGHLIAGGPQLGVKEIRSFLSEVAAMNYRISITELDIRDTPLPPDIALRDRMVADLGRRYLDVVLDEPAVTGIITWGFSDKYTWLNAFEHFPRQARKDRLVNRALPLDVEMQPKLLYHAIGAAFDGARQRGPAKPIRR